MTEHQTPETPRACSIVALLASALAVLLVCALAILVGAGVAALGRLL